MIFFITGRIGSGSHHFVEKMRTTGYHDVLPELVALDGHPIPTFDDNLPSYAVAEPDQIKEILNAFPNELFHIIHICIDETNGETRRNWYISEYGNPDEAPAMFDRFDTEESSMYDAFEKSLDLNSPDTPDNLRAVHTITNNHDDVTQHDWVNHFINFHRMYLRLIKIAKLSVKIKAVNADDNGNIIVFYRGKTDETPTRELTTPEKFADILLSDNTGLATVTKALLEKATNEDLADILSD